MSSGRESVSALSPKHHPSVTTPAYSPCCCTAQQGEHMRSFTIGLFASTAFATQPALAQQAPVQLAAAEESVIVVFGEGETRQVQQVEATDIQILTPGTSPIRAIEKLPSVNVQASDPFGSY